MTTISMFYGIVICTFMTMSGAIPAAKVRLVQAWIEIHRESLLADWELAVNGQTPFAIDPLR